MFGYYVVENKTDNVKYLIKVFGFKDGYNVHTEPQDIPQPKPK
tara:strand:- start:407 stop:535 length:129 start_codon:yes stop_codon:yes gene_type:complete